MRFGFISFVLGVAIGSYLMPTCPPISPTTIQSDIPLHTTVNLIKAVGRTGAMEAHLSAYDLGPGSINVDEYLENGKTSIGKEPIPGRTIAVDPKVIPYGSKVFIPGIGWRVAEDTGEAVRGRRIDILMDSEEKALQFGRRTEIVLWIRP
jgi:3D (Asp-Asp-Asp) domain-containing protein